MKISFFPYYFKHFFKANKRIDQASFFEFFNFSFKLILDFQSSIFFESNKDINILHLKINKKLI